MAIRPFDFMSNSCRGRKYFSTEWHNRVRIRELSCWRCWLCLPWRLCFRPDSITSTFTDSWTDRLWIWSTTVYSIFKILFFEQRKLTSATSASEFRDLRWLCWMELQRWQKAVRRLGLHQAIVISLHSRFKYYLILFNSLYGEGALPTRASNNKTPFMLPLLFQITAKMAPDEKTYYIDESSGEDSPSTPGTAEKAIQNRSICISPLWRSAILCSRRADSTRVETW